MQPINLWIIALSLFFTTPIFAQETFHWNNIAFTLSDDFDVTQQGRNTFEAIGDGLEIRIAAFSDDAIDADDISDVTLALAIDLKLEEVDAAAEIDLNGLEGAYVEGYKNGDRIFLMGMIDPDSDDNFFAVITFGDDDDYAEETAIDIFASFRQH